MNPTDRVYNRFDVGVLDGHNLNPMHKIIFQRTLTWWTHCVFFTGVADQIWDPTFGGIQNRSISNYAGRKISVLRRKGLRDYRIVGEQNDDMETWLAKTIKESVGYDYLALFGFLLGRESFQCDNRWYCAELPYRFFQRIDRLKLTRVDLAFVYPSFFYQSNDFELVYEFTDKSDHEPYFNSTAAAVALNMPAG